MKWLTLIGIGEDGVLSAAARDRLQQACAVYGGARHLALAGVSGKVWPSPMAGAFPDLLAHRPEPVAVLASGDPLWFGVGATLARLAPWDEITCLPAPSALSLACARLGWAAHDVAAVSLCGRPVLDLLGALRHGRKLVALSADASTPGDALALMTAHGFGHSRVHLMEALGGPHERVRTMRAGDRGPTDIHPLNLLAIEPSGPRRPNTVLPDEAFAHDGQLTKQHVRAVTLAALAPVSGELLWDVGAGSGAVGIEWMRMDPANRAIAFERDPVRAGRAAANASALGAPGLRIVAARAPCAFQTMPAPDAVFLGGGAPESLDASWAALRPGGRLVANAVTIETEQALLERHALWGGAMTRIGVDQLGLVGRYHAFRPAMTVTQFVACKP